MAKGTRAYVGCYSKGDDRMHSMSEWNRVYGKLVMMDEMLHGADSLAKLVIKVLMMLVEDKIKEMAE